MWKITHDHDPLWVKRSTHGFPEHGQLSIQIKVSVTEPTEIRRVTEQFGDDGGPAVTCIPNSFRKQRPAIFVCMLSYQRLSRLTVIECSLHFTRDACNI